MKLAHMVSTMDFSTPREASWPRMSTSLDTDHSSDFDEDRCYIVRGSLRLGARGLDGGDFTPEFGKEGILVAIPPP